MATPDDYSGKKPTTTATAGVPSQIAKLSDIDDPTITAEHRGVVLRALDRIRASSGEGMFYSSIGRLEGTPAVANLVPRQEAGVAAQPRRVPPGTKVEATISLLDWQKEMGQVRPSTATYTFQGGGIPPALTVRPGTGTRPSARPQPFGPTEAPFYEPPNFLEKAALGFGAPARFIAGIQKGAITQIYQSVQFETLPSALQRILDPFDISEKERTGSISETAGTILPTLIGIVTPEQSAELAKPSLLNAVAFAVPGGIQLRAMSTMGQVGLTGRRVVVKQAIRDAEKAEDTAAALFTHANRVAETGNIAATKDAFRAAELAGVEAARLRGVAGAAQAVSKLPKHIAATKSGKAKALSADTAPAESILPELEGTYGAAIPPLDKGGALVSVLEDTPSIVRGTANLGKSLGKSLKLLFETDIGPVNLRTIKAAYGKLNQSLAKVFTDKRAYANDTTRDAERAWIMKYGEEMPPEVNAALQLQLHPGAYEAGYVHANQVLRTIKEAAKLAGVSTKEVRRYIVLRRAIEVARATDRPGPLAPGVNTIDDALVQLQEVRAFLGDAKFSKLEEVARLVVNAHRDMLLKAVEEGIVSRNEAARMIRDMPWYNPTRYIATDIHPMTTGGGSPRVGPNMIKHLGDVGIDAVRQDPFVAMQDSFGQWENLFSINRATKSLIHNYNMSPDNAEVIRLIQPGTPPRSGYGVVTTLSRGKLQHWEAPLDFASAIKEDVGLSNRWLKILARTTQAPFRFGYTAGFPLFWTKSFVHDVVMGWMQHGVLPTKTGMALLKNLKAIVKTDPGWERMFTSKMGMETYTRRSAQVVARDSLNRPNNIVLRTTEDALRFFGNIPRGIQRVGEAVEFTGRRAVFERILEKTGSEALAAKAARDAFVDFSRSGTLFKAISDYWLYANAATQGFLIPYRAARTNPAFNLRLGAFLLAEFGRYRHNSQFESYKNLPIWQKYQTSFFIIGEEEVDGVMEARTVTVLPIKREIAAITGPLNYLLEELEGGAPETFSQMMSQVLTSSNPMGPVFDLTDDWKTAAIPLESLKILNDVNNNKSSFNGRDIIPEAYVNKPWNEQFNRDTSQAAIRIGNFLGKSPMQIDYMMKRGVYKHILEGVDAWILLHEEDPELSNMAEELRRVRDGSPSGSEYRETEKYLNEEVPAALRNDVKELARKFDRDEEKSGIPGFTALTSMFYRTSGGGIYQAGLANAAETMNISVDQTRKFSANLGMVAEALDIEMEAYGAQLQAQGISGGRYRALDRAQGDIWKGVFMTLGVQFPQSAQELEGEGYQKFLTIINTLAGQVEDVRSEGELLYSGWRAIQPQLDDKGIEDMDMFFKQRDLYRENLSPERRDLLQDEISARLEPVALRREQHLRILRPYFEVRDAYIKANPGVEIILNQLDIAERITKDQRQIEFLKSLPIYKDMNTYVSQERLEMRRAQPYLEGLLRYWGYGITVFESGLLGEQAWRSIQVP